MDKFQELFAKFNLEENLEDFEKFNTEFTELVTEKGKGKVKTDKEKTEKVDCEGITKKGEQCKKKAQEGNTLCTMHQKTSASSSASVSSKLSKSSKSKVDVQKCNGVTEKGIPCSNGGTRFPDGSTKGYCFRHVKNWVKFEEEKEEVKAEDEDDDFTTDVE